MVDVATLQSKLSERAESRARKDAEAAISNLPYFKDIKVYPEDGDKLVKVDSWRLRTVMKQAIYDEMYTKYLREETERLLSAVDQIEEIASTVDNIQREG